MYPTLAAARLNDLLADENEMLFLTMASFASDA